VKGGLLLDVVISQRPPIFQLLPSENQPLLVWWDPLLVLDLRLDVVDGVGALDFQGDGLASEGLDEDLHSTAETEDQVECALLLDVVIGEGAAVFELLAGEDKPLLVRWDSFLVLDFRLDVVDGVGAFDLESDSLAGQGLNEDLHTTTETEDEMESRLLLDVVIGEGAAVFKLLSGEDESLLVRGDSFLVLDLGLDVINGVGAFDLQGDSLSGESFHKDLHATAETEDEMKCGLLLDVVVS